MGSYDSYGLLLTAGNNQKEFINSSNKKTPPTNVATSYRSILQETVAEVSRQPVKNANNSTFTSSTSSSVLRGDANDDGVVDENDFDLLQQHLIELGSVKNFRAADMDGDGEITPTDVSQLSLMLQEVRKYDINGDGKLDDMDGALLRNEVTHSAALTSMDKTKADFSGDGVVDYADVKILDGILGKRSLDNFSGVASGVKGDVNNDGKIDFADTYLLDKTVADYSGLFSDGSLFQISSNSEIAKQADVDDDGKLTLMDLMALKKATNNYSDIHIFKMKSDQAIFYSDMSCTEASYKNPRSGSNLCFLTQVVDETEDAYKVVMQARTTREAQEYWIKKSSIKEDLTPEVDKLVTKKMGISIVPRGYNEQLPTMTEEVTDSARIFHVDLGYTQGEHYKEEGGLFITNLNVEKDLNEEKPIIFDVYNTKDAAGFVEYYDENGKFIRADRIEPHDAVIKDFSSWWEKARNTFDSIVKYGFGDMPITHPLVSKLTTLEAPKGTHRVVVTNNQTESIYAYVNNMVEKFFAAQEIAHNFKKVIEADNAFDEDVEVNKMLEDVKEKLTTKIIQTLQVNAARMALDNFSNEYDAGYETGKYILQTIGEEGLKNWALEGFDLREAFEDSVEYAISNLGTFAVDEVKGIAWGACKDLLNGNPAILGLEALKATGNVLDYLSKLITEKQLENVKPMVFQFEV